MLESVCTMSQSFQKYLSSHLERGDTPNQTQGPEHPSLSFRGSRGLQWGLVGFDGKVLLQQLRPEQHHLYLAVGDFPD